MYMSVLEFIFLVAFTIALDLLYSSACCGHRSNKMIVRLLPEVLTAQVRIERGIERHVKLCAYFSVVLYSKLATRHQRLAVLVIE